MSYSIMRVAKVKSGVNTTGIQKHVQRENKNYNNKDIVSEKTADNYDLLHGKEKKNYRELIEKRIKDGYTGKRKIRSDAVRHVDGIITSDKDFFDGLSQEQTEKYFRDSLEFLQNEYGKKNMLYAAVHMDESTPHMHFGAVPLTKDGRLSAKEVVGNKKALTNLQDGYNQFMNERGFHLERGQSKQVTEKRHEDMDKYKQGTAYHEKIFRQTQEKAQQEERKLNALTQTLQPKELQYESREIKTEVKDKLFGKAEISETETGNVVLTPEQYKKAAQQINAAAAIQNDYKRLKGTDLAQENERLRTDNEIIYSDWKRLNMENKQLYQENEELKQENSKLKTQYKALKKNCRIIYNTTKQATQEKFQVLKDRMKQLAEKYHTADAFNQLEKEMERPKKAKQQEHDLSL